MQRPNGFAIGDSGRVQQTALSAAKPRGFGSASDFLLDVLPSHGSEKIFSNKAAEGDFR